MKFWEAMKALDEGKKVRCVLWDKDKYIYLDEDNPDGCLRDEEDMHCFNKYEWWVLLHDDWELFEEPILAFTQMIEGLKAGKKFRRKAWINGGYYICSKDNGTIVNYQEYNPMFDIEDFEATDWEEFHGK